MWWIDEQWICWEHLQGVQGWVASWWHSLTLRQKHLDDKTQSPRCSQIAPIRHKFCWRQLTFTPTDFSTQSSKWVAKKQGRTVHAFISLSLPADSFTYSQQGANYNPYLPTATSKCPHWHLPIDIQITHWKRANWYFHFLFIRKIWQYANDIILLLIDVYPDKE